MLSEKLAKLDLSNVLLSREEYRPFVKAGDRVYWESLPAALCGRLISRGESRLGFDWPALPATLYMENKRNGNRTRYEAACFERRAALGELVLAECAEGRGRFLDNIANGIWATCEESSWCIPAHCPATLPNVDEPIVDLFAAETAALLAWADYLLGEALDDVSPALRARIAHEVNARVLTPYLERDDFWWMGFTPHPEGPVNNWNPWCHSNCLAAFLLLENDGGRRRAAIEKCVRSLDVFLSTYRDDGGCDEGTSYWGMAGGALFDCLEQLDFTTRGALAAWNEPLIAAIGRFIFRSHIAGDYYINFADGGARVRIPAELVWRYGRRIGDRELEMQGAAAYRLGGLQPASVVYGSLYRALSGIRNHQALTGLHAAPPLVRDVWLDGIEVMAARERQGSAAGLYLAAKGGHNHESHNHNDVGSFIVCSEGLPVLIDVGVEAYTAKTFSKDRYSIWTMQSQYHNLPTVNGSQQMNGPQYRAKDVHYSCSDVEATLEMDISAAYPAEAGIEIWKRSFHFKRDGKASIQIADEYGLRHTSDITFNLMTCREHALDSGSIRFTVPGGKDVLLRFDGTEYEATSERVDIFDERLAPVWGDHIYRIMLRARKPQMKGKSVIRMMQA